MNPYDKITEGILEEIMLHADRNLLKATYGTAKGAHHPGTEPKFTTEHLIEAMQSLPLAKKQPVGFVCHSSYLRSIREQSKQTDTTAVPDPAGNTLSALYGIQFYPDDEQEHPCLAFYDEHQLRLWLQRRALWSAILQDMFNGNKNPPSSAIPAPKISEKEARDIHAQGIWPYSVGQIIEFINQRP